jgi:hypothetical protein
MDFSAASMAASIAGKISSPAHNQLQVLLTATGSTPED